MLSSCISIDFTYNMMALNSDYISEEHNKTISKHTIECVNIQWGEP